MPPQFSYQNRGFINYVFCRNWAIRNPAGTRLDSSLVNKQVGPWMPAKTSSRVFSGIRRSQWLARYFFHLGMVILSVEEMTTDQRSVSILLAGDPGTGQQHFQAVRGDYLQGERRSQ